MLKKPITLIVLDGWGYREETKNNAIAEAKTPYFDKLWNTYPHTLLYASGEAVGLPDGQMGNSEVGHSVIGAGAVIDTDLVRIRKAIVSGEYKSNKAFVSAFDHVKNNNSCLHIMGLLSDGGVHSHTDHLLELLRAASYVGIKNIAVHVFTDGRDTNTTSSVQYLKELEELLNELDCGFIATVSGRYFPMDRDKNWDRLDKFLKIFFSNEGNTTEMTPSDFVASQHKIGISDEHIEPTIIKQKGNDHVKVEKNDAIIFTNFRSDRACEISEKVLEKKSDMNLCFVTMTEYKQGLDSLIAFPVKNIETNLAEQISKAGFSQAHMAETEKFPHATYYLNCGREAPYPKEIQIILDSKKDVATHDLAPGMRALDIAEKVVGEIESGTDFIFVNIANPDMVGHTANVPAIISALETTDKALALIVDSTMKNGGIAIVTADHGNAEINKEKDGSPHTAHTCSLVPCIITDKEINLNEKGALADIAPTVLDYFGIEKPKQMTGENLKK